jgi:ribosomal protein S17E
MAPMVPASLENSEQEMQKMSNNVEMSKMVMDSVLDMVPLAAISIKERLCLKHINEFDFDFDDVIENVDKLMTYYFKADMEFIQKTVDDLCDKYGSKICGDYDKFLDLAEKNRDIKKWLGVHNKLVADKGDVANSVLDLYFQMAMVPCNDVFNDVFILAYLETIQPYLN